MIQYLFPGLKEGDKWCLCASRWAQALSANVAPKIYLSATHERTLQFATLAQLMAHVRAWLLHDILSRRGFCARINDYFSPPPDLHCHFTKGSKSGLHKLFFLVEAFVHESMIILVPAHAHALRRQRIVLQVKVSNSGLRKLFG